MDYIFIYVSSELKCPAAFIGEAHGEIIFPSVVNIFLSISARPGNTLIFAALKVARSSIFVRTPSIFESLRLKQMDLYRKHIITNVLHID